MAVVCCRCSAAWPSALGPAADGLFRCRTACKDRSGRNRHGVDRDRLSRKLARRPLRLHRRCRRRRRRARRFLASARDRKTPGSSAPQARAVRRGQARQPTQGTSAKRDRPYRNRSRLKRGISLQGTGASLLRLRLSRSRELGLSGGHLRELVRRGGHPRGLLRHSPRCHRCSLTRRALCTRSKWQWTLRCAACSRACTSDLLFVCPVACRHAARGLHCPVLRICAGGCGRAGR